MYLTFFIVYYFLTSQKREILLKDLSCAEDDEVTTTSSVSSSVSVWAVTTDSVFTDQDTTTETSTEENATTEHEDDINQSTTIVVSPTTRKINFATEYKIPTKPMKYNKINRINNNYDKNLDLNLAHNNNLQSNYIPKIANGENYLSNEQLDKIEDEKHMQHKMLHEEIARLGNLENIFTQPTDHFVPPLVMAKAKISDDMTVLSLQEKHAQQLAEKHLSKQNNQYNQNEHIYQSDIIKSTSEEPNTVTTNKILTMHTIKSKDSTKKDKIKTSMPKKYIEKVYDPKNRVQKTVETKPVVLNKTTDQTSTQTESITKHTDTTSLPLVGRLDDDDSSMDLTVLLKDSPDIGEEKTFYNYSGDVSRLEVVKNSTINNETEINLYDLEATEVTKQENGNTFKEINSNMTMNHEVINITIISEVKTATVNPIMFNLTTKIPMADENKSTTSLPIFTKKVDDDVELKATAIENLTTTINPFESETVLISAKNYTEDKNNTNHYTTNSPVTTTTTTTTVLITTTTLPNNNTTDKTQYVNKSTTTRHIYTSNEENIDHFNAETHDEFDMHTNSSETLDDFNSPLLSGANEPLRRPVRSRRPQPPPNRNKFNPFRILG